ncbi:AsmA-like C-terminal region-containing protein [Granulicella sp. dw_53]|uniref:AsmA-like C-terminal region-containing protein n=1 Tax=Granulicella sp. dw_53 TaxID=2719792 RepID=UPI00210845C3|nr:AsmA-like C-terminal region-containing protein [Granulicella sp. dw_53]
MANENVPTHESKRRGFWWWTGFTALIAVAVLALVGTIMVKRADPIMKGRVIETLSTRFQSKVELDDFQVALGRGLEVTGKGLRIYPPDDVVAAGANKPLIGVGSFEFHSGLRGLFLKPMHVGTVHVSGLAINIPPKEQRQAGAKRERHAGKIKIQVDEIVVDDSRLIIGTLKPGKDPKDFELQRIELHNVGPSEPWRYEATLVNAIPKGDIHAKGTFGPWVTESPGDSAVTGHYTFDNADMNTIKGIGGMMSSVGEFTGQLNRIGVNGTTDIPNFSIDTANHPMSLHTKFDAVVDGLTGDTYLNQVDARLGGSDMSAKGMVVNVKGKGHIIDITVDVPHGRIQDFLLLAVKTQPVLVTGGFSTKTRLYIPPGKVSVSQKMALKGAFTMRQIHFTNEKVQDKVDMLSLRAQGDPKEAKPGAEDVQSEMKGQFTMNAGRLTFSNLGYTLPGAKVQLAGVYSLDGNEFDFHGKVRTDAKVSQMVASRWKSWLLKPVDPFFKGKDGQGGSEIPVKITGTKSEPKFGLDLHHKDEANKGK